MSDCQRCLELENAAATLRARVAESDRLLHDAQGLILEGGQLCERLVARTCEQAAQVRALQKANRLEVWEVKELQDRVLELEERTAELACRDVTIELHESTCPMVTSQDEGDCNCLQLRLSRAEATVGRLCERLRAIDQIRKRLPDADFGEQQTTARAIGEVVHAALTEAQEEEK